MFASGGGLAVAFILVATGATDAMTDRWFWLIVALSIATAGTYVGLLRGES